MKDRNKRWYSSSVPMVVLPTNDIWSLIHVLNMINQMDKLIYFSHGLFFSSFIDYPHKLQSIICFSSLWNKYTYYIVFILHFTVLLEELTVKVNKKYVQRISKLPNLHTQKAFQFPITKNLHLMPKICFQMAIQIKIASYQ